MMGVEQRQFKTGNDWFGKYYTLVNLKPCLTPL